MTRYVDMPEEWRGCGEHLGEGDHNRGHIEECDTCAGEEFTIIQGHYLTLGVCVKCGHIQELASG